MPEWAGKWKGGRFYFDEDGKKVFFIERRVEGRQRTFKLRTHDEELATGELARFHADPAAYARPAPAGSAESPVFITSDRINDYLKSIADTVADHRLARRNYLLAWSAKRLDLRSVDRKALRKVLGEFDGGHRGRTEALNAFSRWLVKEGELPSWRPLENDRPPAATRAAREAYTVEQLRQCFKRLDGDLADLFRLRAATGMHHTEIAQLEGARVLDGLLPEKGPAIRKLDGKHEIAGVLQVTHKNGQRHRQSVEAATLAAALRLVEGVPSRIDAWEAFDPLVPSNLRHTFVTLAGEVGELVTYSGGGVDRARVAQAVGHRAGSTMTADRYEKIQVPPMIRLPLGF